jgi:hypothetical protein
MIASYNYELCPGPNIEWVIHLRRFSPVALVDHDRGPDARSAVGSRP